MSGRSIIGGVALALAIYSTLLGGLVVAAIIWLHAG